MNRKLFLFDCDGVPVDSLAVFEGTVRECLAVIGQPIINTREDFLDLFDDNFYTAITQRGVYVDAFMQAAGPILARVNFDELVKSRKMSQIRRLCKKFAGKARKY